jgi:hypothetical protein
MPKTIKTNQTNHLNSLIFLDGQLVIVDWNIAVENFGVKASIARRHRLGYFLFFFFFLNEKNIFNGQSFLGEKKSITLMRLKPPIVSKVRVFNTCFFAK